MELREYKEELREYKEALDKIRIPKTLNQFNIKCLRYEGNQNSFYYYIFTCEFKTEEDLLENYNAINEVIAFDFQSSLEKNIERWNLYIFYFIEGEIKNSTKYSIQQDKYATRKIVIECNNESILNGDKIQIINRKLFKLNINIKKDDYSLGNIDSIDSIITSRDKELEKFIIDYTSNRLIDLKKGNKYLKRAILEYLGVEDNV